ncbi:MAG: hypothetical protein GY865_03840 [candidate division Zixibacteria bacterium]|nr:hypothetical protein [candidate division Zixibacteria bacterium]
MNLRHTKIITWMVCLTFLVGVAFAGNGNILCIDDKGYVEFESFCVSCCDEAEENCGANFANEIHTESEGCSDCSDIEINGPLWSKRIQTIDTNQLRDFASKLTINTYFSPLSIGEHCSQIQKFYLAYGQSPPEYSIVFLSTTVVRC